MQHIELHALGQIDIGGNKAKAVGFFAAGGLDIGDAAAGLRWSSLSNIVRHDRPPVLISMTRTLGWICGRTKSIFNNPFSNAADLTSMPSASTKARKNCRAAMPR